MKPQIETTLDYDKFRTVEGNREVDTPHVRQLAEEIALNDLTPYFPVLINQDWEIIDGQHRFEVCRTLTLPIYYLQVPGLDLKSVQRINTSSKRWNLRDYIQSYIQRIGSIIRQGNFKVVDRSRAEDMAILLKSLRDYADFDPTKERSLVFALNKVTKHERFDTDRLLAKLRERGLKLDRQSVVRYYIIELERIYNHGSRLRLDLFTGEEVQA